MNIQTVEIERINPAAYNPRKDLKPGDVEYEKLKKSILEFDMVEPLVWNKRSGNLVGGHQRLKILKELGTKQIEVSVVDLEDVKEKALNLALNKISGEWDLPALKDLLEELDTGDFDMEITGFDDKEIEDLMNQLHEPEEGNTEDDAVPEATESICKKGDLWSLGNHRLLCGDATVITDVERLMGGEKADMVFTDPPYGKGGYAGRSGKFKPMQGDDLPTKVFYSCIPCDITERYVWGGFPNFVDLDVKNWPRDVIIWRKNNFGMGRGYRGQYELCFYWGSFSGSDSDVWEVDKDVNYKHPTQKPVALGERAINNSSHLRNIVLDIFGGSGSTLIACQKLDRRCYMMEIDEHYCDVIIKRWEQFTGKQAVRIDAKEINTEEAVVCT